MIRFRPLCAFAAVLISSTFAAPAFSQAAPEPDVGLYDGHQVEVGAMLQLGEDGRYRYQLAYGALDEWSTGTWKKDGNAVVLSSDPFTPPAFEVSRDTSPAGTLIVAMDLPEGFDAQYVGITVVRADGSASFENFGTESLQIAMGDNPVVSVKPILPVMELMGDAMEIPAGGATLRITFTPHDLGFAGFRDQRLERKGDAFELTRYGLAISFRKVQAAD